MRSRGWAGVTPSSDEEAISRILDAVDDEVAQHGPGIRLADVARRLGVTRQTVYRYFPNADALLIASAMRAVNGFIDQVIERANGLNDPVAAIVESVSFGVENLAGDPQLEALLTRRAEGKPPFRSPPTPRWRSACRYSAVSMLIGHFTDFTTTLRWMNSPK